MVQVSSSESMSSIVDRGRATAAAAAVPLAGGGSGRASARRARFPLRRPAEELMRRGAAVAGAKGPSQERGWVGGPLVYFRSWARIRYYNMKRLHLIL